MQHQENVEPLVTVYIPTFNRKKLLERAVNSVLTQTYENIELIIVDDGSTDNTLAYLETLARNDNRVVVMGNQRSKGACGARNTAIFEAKGKFITGLDDDDYFLSNRVRDFVDAWELKDRDIVALSGRYFIKRSDRHIIEQKAYLIKKVKKYMLFHRNLIGNQVFTETETLRNLGGFDESVKIWQDLDVWLRLLDVGFVQRLNIANYVVDMSHEHERMTTTKSLKAVESHKIIVGKHSLSRIEKRVFNNMLKIYIEPATMNSVLSKIKRRLLFFLSYIKNQF